MKTEIMPPKREVLSWKIPSPQAQSRGILANDAGTDRHARVAILPATSSDTTETESTSDISRYDISKYELIAWREAIADLKIDAECNLTQVGKVNVRNIFHIGNNLRESKIIVEGIR